MSITDTVTSCNHTSWGNKADAAATNLSSYQHRAYIVPADVNCSWAGLAHISSCPGTCCQAWVKACSSQACGYVDAIGHEMGHNLGLMHASMDTGNDGTIDCEYCDDSDFMGYAEANLRPLVSYRTAIGYDSFLTSTAYSSGLVNKTSIHRWPGGVNNTLFVTALADGQSFTDPANSLTIVQNSHTASTVTLTVSIGLLPPTNLKATAGDTQVVLSWTASVGATGYNVKRATTSGGTYLTVASDVSGTAYTDWSVTNGTTYYYVVRR